MVSVNAQFNSDDIFPLRILKEFGNHVVNVNFGPLKQYNYIIWLRVKEGEEENVNFNLFKIAFIECDEKHLDGKKVEIKNSKIIVNNNSTFHFESINFLQKEENIFKNILFINRKSRIKNLLKSKGNGYRFFFSNLNIKNLTTFKLFDFEYNQKKYGSKNFYANEIEFNANTFENIQCYRFIDNSITSNSKNLKFYMNFNYFRNISSNDSGFFFNNTDTLFFKNYFISNFALNGIFRFINFTTQTIFTENVFTDNFSDKDKRIGVINTQSEFIKLKRNVFNDLNAFELVYLIPENKLKFIDISENYWYEVSNKSEDLIYDGISNRPSLAQLRRNPSYVIPLNYTSRKCGFQGWTFMNFTCNFIHFGPMTYKGASKFCANLQGSLLTNDKVKGIKNMFKVIFNNASISFDFKNDYWIKGLSSSDNFHKPFVCILSNIGSCENDCSGNGICSEDKCFCDSGWEGKDCYRYHCNNTNNCNKNGDCIGPNICKCYPGWEGSSCSISICPRYSKCRECTKKNGCGWCDSKQICLPGTPDKPSRKCSLWFYNNCFSIAPGKCSPEIHMYNCKRDFCDKFHPFTTCSQCLQLSKCFKTTNQNCQIWNEKICPNGLLQSETSFENNKFSFKQNVYRVKENEKFFNCKKKPKVSENHKGNFQIFYIRSNTAIIENMIYVSNRGNRGIRHRIVNILSENDNSYTIAVGQYAYLNEYFENVDGKFKGNFFESEKNTNEKDIKNFLKSKQNYKEITNEKKLKCLGSKFNYMNTQISSYFILTKSDIEIEKGEILVEKNKIDFIERITRKEKTKQSILIEAEILNCTNLEILGNFENFQHLEKISYDFDCSSENTSQTLYSIRSQDFSENLHMNSLIIGKESSQLLSYVVNSSTLKNGWKMIEIINLKSLTHNLLVSDIEKSKLIKNGVSIFSNRLPIIKSYKNISGESVRNLLNLF